MKDRTITVYYTDGTFEAFHGDCETSDRRLHIYTSSGKIVKIPFTSIKKHIVE